MILANYYLFFILEWWGRERFQAVNDQGDIKGMTVSSGRTMSVNSQFLGGVISRYGLFLNSQFLTEYFRYTCCGATDHGSSHDKHHVQF